MHPANEPTVTHHTFEELCDLRSITDLTIVFSSRMQSSWRLQTKNSGAKTLTLPAAIRIAPDTVKNALIDWAYLKKPHFLKNRPLYLQQKKLLEKAVWHYLSTVSEGKPLRRAITDQRIDEFKIQGNCYNLKTIFDAVNHDFFDSRVSSYLRWGAPKSKTSYQSNHTDAAGSKISIITIAGIYNLPGVPEYAIKSVMYHEMLHIVVPPYTKNGRRVVHGQEFKAAEKKNPDLARWHAWERHDLHSLLRKKHPPKKRAGFFGLFS